jgi:hypothetical protein
VTNVSGAATSFPSRVLSVVESAIEIFCQSGEAWKYGMRSTRTSCRSNTCWKSTGTRFSAKTTGSFPDVAKSVCIFSP